MSKGLLDNIFEGKGPIREFLKKREVTKDNLTKEQEKITNEFIEGLASGLDLSPDLFDKIEIRNWMLGFLRSFIRPEMFDDTIEPDPMTMRSFGKDLGMIIENSARSEKVEPEPEPEPVKTEEQPDQPSKEPIRERVRRLIAIDQ